MTVEQFGPDDKNTRDVERILEEAKRLPDQESRRSQREIAADLLRLTEAVSKS